MKYFTLLLLFVFSDYFFSYSQPSIQWQKSLGGTNIDVAQSIQQTIDGGYIVAGFINSNDGDVTGNHGREDYWIVKLDTFGNIEWQKSLGGDSTDIATSIKQTNDGGYIVAGYSRSNNGDVSGSHDTAYSNNYIYDFWIVRLNNLGGIIWQKSLGGNNYDGASSIEQTSDRGFIVAGSTSSNNGDVIGNHLGYDCWIIKLDSLGNIDWQKCLGGIYSEFARSIQQTYDGGYIVAGSAAHNNGDVTGNHGHEDYWIVKLDSSGVLLWQKSFGGTKDDIVESIYQTNNGGYIIAGWSESNDGDVNGNHGNFDYWIVKLDYSGVISWQKSFGGTNHDIAKSIQQTKDGGFIVAGRSESNNGDVTGNYGNFDYWIVKLDTLGNIEWQKCFGGTVFEEARSIQQTTDEGYIIAGYSWSNDGDVTGNHGGNTYDYWIVKLNSLVNINEFQNLIINFQITPSPFSSLTTLSFQLAASKKASINIRDIEGRLIRYLTAKNFNIGKNEVVWDATNNSGAKVDNGLYFITISSDNFSETKKVVVMRD